MDKEDAFLLSQAQDKLKQCENRNIITSTAFLDQRQQSLLRKELGQYTRTESVFYGGYDDAERCMLIFLPDYADLSMFDGLQCIGVKTASALPKPLTHRDYLGALMGLGIKREMIGDILVRENGADILILSEMKQFIMVNFNQAGHAHFQCEEINLQDMDIPKTEGETKRDTVPSLRLDCVVSSAFSMSRGNAGSYIDGGKVFLNGIQIFKKDFKVNEGDKMVIHGKGKAILREIGGTSKKDRIFIEIERFK